VLVDLKIHADTSDELCECLTAIYAAFQDATDALRGTLDDPTYSPTLKITPLGREPGDGRPIRDFKMEILSSVTDPTARG
jgi:hypothetical protein